MEYEFELQKIKDARNRAYKLNVPILVVLLVGILLSFAIPFLAPVTGIVAFILFYSNIVKVARMPCPKCNSPFGTNSRIVLGVGVDKCQSCGLPLW